MCKLFFFQIIGRYAKAVIALAGTVLPFCSAGKMFLPWCCPGTNIHGETQLGTDLAETRSFAPKERYFFQHTQFSDTVYHIAHQCLCKTQRSEQTCLGPWKGRRETRGLIIFALLPKSGCDFTCKKEWLILKLALWGLYIVVASSDSLK